MDLNALQQKINNYITVVSSWVRNVSKLYFSGTPENVTVDMIDDDGNLTTSTLPNVAQFRKTIWDDVGSAIGQFNKKFYVNSDNGDDSNAGSSSSPFKTIKKALDSVPVGGRGRIFLYYGKTYYINANADVANKVIEFYGIGDKTLEKPIIHSKSYINSAIPDNTSMYYLNCAIGSQFSFNDIGFKYEGKIDGKDFIGNYFQSTLILLNGGAGCYFNKCEIDISTTLNTQFVLITHYISNPFINIHSSAANLGDNYLINNRANAPISYIAYSFAVTANTDTILQQIRNILRDADSGNPVNIISNINFSS